jgi:cyanate permease
MGLAQSVGSLSRVFGPIIAGSLFSAFGRGSPYFWGAALVGCALLIGWRGRRDVAPAAGPAK